MSKKELTPKQRLFVAEYPKDFNASAAYIRAGYSKTGANRAASLLLTNVVISKAIKEIIKKREESVIVTEKMVINGLLAETKELDDGSSTTRIKAWSQLGKTLAMFIDKKQVDTKVSVEDELKRLLSSD